MKILIVDDEKVARYGIRKALEPSAEILEAADLSSARQVLRSEHPDLLLLDLNLGEEDGFRLLEGIQERPSPPRVVIITAHGNERVAVDAMKKGAFDYVAKPFDIEELRLIVRNAGEQVRLQREVQELRAQLAADAGYGEIIGASRAMKKVYALVEKIAETDVTVLICGESGSGKELIARELHRRSPRSAGKLVTVNCAAIPRDLLESELFGHEKGAFTGASERRIGKFEHAHRGSLFLDEIGDMPLETQAKILRALEQKVVQRVGGIKDIPVDVRIISATNKDLPSMVEKGQFREDLYYRLEVIKIEVPPLRQRDEDISLLLDHFLESFCQKHKRNISEVTPAALLRLLNYEYPGNVRQLRNMVERMVILNSSGVIDENDLPREIGVRSTHGSARNASVESFLEMDFKQARTSFEAAYLIRHLEEHDFNISRTAESIGMHRQSLQQKIKRLGLKKLWQEIPSRN